VLAQAKDDSIWHMMKLRRVFMRGMRENHPELIIISTWFQNKGVPENAGVQESGVLLASLDSAKAMKPRMTAT
jgi:hypothetical protein